MTIRYDAFISYSHAADKPFAAELQHVIQTIGKPWYRLRSLRVFRDDTSLSATPGLWPSIEAALTSSRYLILLASPEAGSSSWVEREVEHWLSNKGVGTLLIALTAGELQWDVEQRCFRAFAEPAVPPSLRRPLEFEPRWLDARQLRTITRANKRRFRDIASGLAARIRGIPKEDLYSLELTERKKALTLAWSAAGLLAAFAAVAAWQWVDAERSRREAEQQTLVAQRERDKATANEATARKNLSRGLSEKAGARLELNRHNEASVFAASALTLDSGNWQARAILYQSKTSSLFQRSVVYSHTGDCFGISPDLKRVARCEDAGEVDVEDATTGRMVLEYKPEPLDDGNFPVVDDVIFTADARSVVIYGDQTTAIDLETSGKHAAGDAPCERSIAGARRIYALDNATLAMNCADGLHIVNTKSWKTEMIASGAEISASEFGTRVYGHDIARASLNRDRDILALYVSAQTEDYTGEADNSGFIRLFHLSTGREFGYIFSGRIETLQLTGDGGGLMVAKRGGRIELWNLSQPVFEEAESSPEPSSKPDAKAAITRLRSYMVLMDAEPGEQHDDLSPAMHRTEFRKLKPMDLAINYGGSKPEYAVLNGGMLSLFDVGIDQMPYSDTAARSVASTLSAAPQFDAIQAGEGRIAWFNGQTLAIKVVPDATRVQGLPIRYIVAEMSRPVGSRTGFENLARNTSRGFLYLGIADWGVSCDGRNFLLVYKEADTRYSTRFVALEGDVKGRAVRIVETARSIDEISNRYGDVACGAVGGYALASRSHDTTMANRLVSEVGGLKAVSSQDGNVILFLTADDHLAIWDDAKYVQGRPEDLLRGVEEATRLTVEGGMSVKFRQ
jgi:hypothetical protein